MKLDILAFAAHPDDVELSCSATLLLHKSKGKRIGIVDLTQGEMGTRGTPETRMMEAETAAKILQLDVRENLGFEDCFFINDKAHRMKVVSVIRKYQPQIVLANAITDRHPDHGRAAQLVSESCFLAGLKKTETFIDGKAQDSWKVKTLYHYIQDRYIKPDVVVDVSDWFEKKMEAVLAFRSQFYNPSSTEPDTPISSKNFLEFLRSRAEETGHAIGVKYGEGFTAARTIGINNLSDLI
jgi:bacillithiol biosynthesis deacetylase BshB1